MTKQHHYPCDLCGRPSGDDAPACTSCAHQATAVLTEVADWLADDLITAMAKQTALGAAGGGGKPTKKSEQPLPVDLRTSEALAVLRNTLAGWVRVLQGDGATTHPRAATVRSMAEWLAPVISWARTRSYGAEVVDEILAAHHQALTAVDRPHRWVPLPTPCRFVTLDGDRPVPCGGQLHAIIAPGHHADGQIRCSADRAHTTTVRHLIDKRRHPRLRDLTDRSKLRA